MTSYSDLDTLAAKGDGTLWRYGSRWTYSAAPRDVDALGVKRAHFESVPDSRVQAALTSGEWVVFANGHTKDAVRGVVARPASGAPIVARAPSDIGSYRELIGAIELGVLPGTDKSWLAALITGPGGGGVLAIDGAPGAATVGTPYSFTPSATGGSGTRAFALTGSLPAGLSFSTTTGAITGTPTAAGTSSGISITVTDASGTATLSGLSIAVAASGMTGQADFSNPANSGLVGAV